MAARFCKGLGQIGQTVETMDRPEFIDKGHHDADAAARASKPS